MLIKITSKIFIVFFVIITRDFEYQTAEPNINSLLLSLLKKTIH